MTNINMIFYRFIVRTQTHFHTFFVFEFVFFLSSSIHSNSIACFHTVEFLNYAKWIWPKFLNFTLCNTHVAICVHHWLHICWYLFCPSTYSFTDCELIKLSLGFLVLVRTLKSYFYINLTKKLPKIDMKAPKYDEKLVWIDLYLIDFYIFWWINYWFFSVFSIFWKA